MDDKFKGFGTEILTLLVGPDEQKLYIPRGLLDQIPFFKQALVVDGRAESDGNPLKMLEFDPTALADVIQFFWTKAVPKLGETKEDQVAKALIKAVSARVRAYAVAQKLKLAWIRKEIEQQLVLYHQTRHVNPKNLIFLHDSMLQDSFLYKFLVAELGWDFKVHEIERLESAYPGFKVVCEGMSGKLLWDLWKATADIDFDSDKTSPSTQCKWLSGNTISEPNNDEV